VKGGTYKVPPMPEPRSFHGVSTTTLSILMIVTGIAIVVRTLVAGGGPLATGLILGVLFTGAGGCRLYLRRRTQR
jgi:hypothetical protein